MPPIILWIAIAGVASFFLGRATAQPKKAAPRGPLPPIPQLPEPKPDATGADLHGPGTPVNGPTGFYVPDDSYLQDDYSEKWAAATHPIDIFPPDVGDATLERLIPPPAPDAIVVGSGCQVIAVGQEWWSRVNELAATAKYTRGLPDGRVVDTVLRQAAPSCRVSRTTAVTAFRMELTERVAAMPDIRQRNAPYETTVTR